MMRVAMRSKRNQAEKVRQTYDSKKKLLTVSVCYATVSERTNQHCCVKNVIDK